MKIHTDRHRVMGHPLAGEKPAFAINLTVNQVEPQSLGYKWQMSVRADEPRHQGASPEMRRGGRGMMGATGGGMYFGKGGGVEWGGGRTKGQMLARWR